MITVPWVEDIGSLIMRFGPILLNLRGSIWLSWNGYKFDLTQWRGTEFLSDADLVCGIPTDFPTGGEADPMCPLQRSLSLALITFNRFNGQHHFQYFLLYSYLRIHMKSTAHRSPAFSHVHAQKFFSAAIKPPNPSVFFFSHCPARFPIWSCIVENRKRAVLKGKKCKRWTVQCKQSFRIANFNKAIK